MKVKKRVAIPCASKDGISQVVIDYEYDDERDSYTIEFSGELLCNGDVESLATVLSYVPQYQAAYMLGFDS